MPEPLSPASKQAANPKLRWDCAANEGFAWEPWNPSLLLKLNSSIFFLFIFNEAAFLLECISRLHVVWGEDASPEQDLIPCAAPSPAPKSLISGVASVPAPELPTEFHTTLSFRSAWGQIV